MKHENKWQMKRLIVVGLCGVLLVAFLKWSIGQPRRAKREQTRMLLQSLEVAITAYQADYGSVPHGTSSEIKSALAEQPHFDGEMTGYGRECLDGWGRPVLIQVSESRTAIRSFGEDGKDDFGNGDDMEITIPNPRKGKMRQNKNSEPEGSR